MCVLSAAPCYGKCVCVLQLFCESDSGAVSQRLVSSSGVITSLDADQSSSWLPGSCSSTADSEPVELQSAVPLAKVEAVTLMLAVQPGTASLP